MFDVLSGGCFCGSSMGCLMCYPVGNVGACLMEFLMGYLVIDVYGFLLDFLTCYLADTFSALVDWIFDWQSVGIPLRR